MSDHNQEIKPVKGTGMGFQLSILLLFITVMVINFIWTYKNEQEEIIEIATEKADIIVKEYLAAIEFTLQKIEDDQLIVDEESIHDSIQGLGQAGKLFSEQLNLFANFEIKMVSNLPRNMDNMPDLYEQASLTKFDNNPSLKSQHKEVIINNRNYLKYVVPLRIKESCLLCHGEPAGELDVTGFAKEGYKLGELRGAISLMIPLFTEYRHKIRHLIELIIFYLLLTTIAVIISNYILKRMVNLNREISEKNVMLREQHEKLMLYEHEKDKLIEMIVHDLKNPLTTVKSGLEFVISSEAVKDEKMSSVLELAHSGATRLSKMISDILDISMMEEKTFMPQCMVMDFKEFMDSVYNELKMTLADKVKVFDLTFKNEFSPFLIEPNLLRRVIENIVFNSVKHSPPNLAEITVTVEAHDDNDEALISISDKGEGISEEFVERIFDKFFQVESDAHSNFNKGLGLTFCKYAIDLMGGRIWVESEPGRGATFHFTLKTGEECCKRDDT